MHRTWGLMIQRCHNPNNPAYPQYGGRHIVVCDRWRLSFIAFLSDMGDRPTPTHTLERRDNNGPYEPENCCWATKKQQARNRTYNRKLTFGGETKTVAEWSESIGIKSWIIRQRIDRYGWSVERTLTKMPK